VKEMKSFVYSIAFIGLSLLATGCQSGPGGLLGGAGCSSGSCGCADGSCAAGQPTGPLAGLLSRKKHVGPQSHEGSGPGPAYGGQSVGQVTYPYYTTRGPRDFLDGNPPSIGR
ncbi:MAG: hypothetical protein KDB27_35635, partial [Planctomycetales bacterium]|nr:hypothetical protein [Planctomycetales bacterium]